MLYSTIVARLHPHRHAVLCCCNETSLARGERPRFQTTKRRRLEDGGRAGSPGPGGGGRCQGSQQDKVPAFHGVKTENDAFRAFVLYKNQVLDIGLYPTAQTAARAYDRKVREESGTEALCVGGGGGGRE